MAMRFHTITSFSTCATPCLMALLCRTRRPQGLHRKLVNVLGLGDLPGPRLEPIHAFMRFYTSPAPRTSRVASASPARAAEACLQSPTATRKPCVARGRRRRPQQSLNAAKAARPSAKPSLPPLKCLQTPMDDVDPADLREFWRIFERVAKLQRWASGILWRRRRCTSSGKVGSSPQGLTAPAPSPVYFFASSGLLCHV
jgi:hypothetical protein